MVVVEWGCTPGALWAVVPEDKGGGEGEGDEQRSERREVWERREVRIFNVYQEKVYSLQ